MMRQTAVCLFVAGKLPPGVCTPQATSPSCFRDAKSLHLSFVQSLSCSRLREPSSSTSLKLLTASTVHSVELHACATECRCHAAFDGSLTTPREAAEKADRRRQAASVGSAGLPLQLSAVRLAKMGPSKGRGPLIAKFAPVGFKKGFGAVGLGRHTKKGFFLINSMLVPKLHVSENIDCGLKPYVSPETYKFASQKFWEADSDASL